MLKNILTVLAGVFKFFDQVQWFVERLQKTPAEKVRDVIAEVDRAFAKADAIDPKTGKPSDDVSDIEHIINH